MLRRVVWQNDVSDVIPSSIIRVNYTMLHGATATHNLSIVIKLAAEVIFKICICIPHNDKNHQKYM
jgi:hypothetical protein